jgi:hypothetical protein
MKDIIYIDLKVTVTPGSVEMMNNDLPPAKEREIGC